MKDLDPDKIYPSLVIFALVFSAAAFAFCNNCLFNVVDPFVPGIAVITFPERLTVIITTTLPST